LAHDVSSIPTKLMVRLGLLSDSNLVKTASSELGKVHENFIQMVVESKQVKGLSPIFHPDFVSVFKDILGRGGSIELVLTEKVLNKTLETAGSIGAGKLFEDFSRDGRLKIFLVDDLKIALTVTESLFSMGLFYPSGEYDYNSDLVSMHPNALQWGEEIFREYLKQGKKVEC
jgi:predicted transcriptional regulator